ncbi:DUF6249 domain-containing protein [Sungkyunkwania multivorans]|uniref:DUF6249 domain-containing protein n=1 Tax=Sungkyunkwania multivorans TaxID=1173618 RepID=A0ABW3CUI6_9FLAO
MEAAIVLLIIFGTFFGIIYLYFSTRHKERMHLIEKGAQADIFFGKRKNNPSQIWKVVVINLASIIIGIGSGLILAFTAFQGFNHHMEGAQVGIVFLCAGLGLLGGYFLTNKAIIKD